MAFSLSGYVGDAASDALQEVLERRLKEQVRQQQEKQHADQIAIQRQQIDLQQRRDAAMDVERQEDRKYRQGQVERDDASTLASTLEPGSITDPQAALLQKHPGIAPRVTQRQVIDARPIPGTAPLDESAPKQFSVFEPTPAQAREQLRTVNLRRIGDTLKGATTEQQRRAAGAEAFGAGVDVPNNLLGQTGEEKTAQEIAAEQRGNREYDRRARLQNDLISGRSKTGGGTEQGGAYTTERARRTVQGVDNLIGRVSGWTVGRGSLLQYIPETDAADFAADLDTLKSNIAFGELSAMREASKTGGALGAISEKELALLESTLGALSTHQSPQNFRRNLQQIRDTVERWSRERERLMGGGKDPFGGDDDLAELARRRQARQNKP